MNSLVRRPHPQAEEKAWYSLFAHARDLNSKPEKAEISSLAPSCELAVAPVRCSVVTACSSGSMRTSLHTSVSRLAVRSRISLCLIVGSPPLAHESAYSTVKLLPQSHLEGSLDGVQPYRRFPTSRVGNRRNMITYA